MKTIIITYKAVAGKVTEINAHHSNGDNKINNDEINKNYLGIDHTYDNMIDLCDCYSRVYMTPIEHVVLDCDEETQKELEKSLLDMLE